jgi:hypothetical protein
MTAIRTLSRDGLVRLGHGAIAHDAVEGVAVGIEPRLGKLVAKLFDPEKGGPLGSFAAKIRVAYAMGLFGPQTRDELDCIKAVRNAFAHGTLSLDFKTPQIMKICNHFSLYEKSTIVEGLWGNTAKDRYISTVAFVSSRLGANIIAKHKPRQPLRPRGLFSAFATARSWGQLS